MWREKENERESYSVITTVYINPSEKNLKSKTKTKNKDTHQFGVFDVFLNLKQMIYDSESCKHKKIKKTQCFLDRNVTLWIIKSMFLVFTCNLFSYRTKPQNSSPLPF